MGATTIFLFGGEGTLTLTFLFDFKSCVKKSCKYLRADIHEVGHRKNSN